MRLIYAFLAVRMLRLARFDLARSDMLHRSADEAFVSNSVECWFFRRFGADGGRRSVWFVGRFLVRLTQREGRAAGAG
ncbi:hypothetical protein [Methylobacterium oryzae]|jgi:hypothetical protein|uniref:hypothetical protein n=1 Tax=Methylobacterium oryzae TaxID=334852 RepID=UPI000C297E3B|nr:hypothetical protein [Methylobacterium oryzae]